MINMQTTNTAPLTAADIAAAKRAFFAARGLVAKTVHPILAARQSKGGR